MDAVSPEALVGPAAAANPANPRDSPADPAQAAAGETAVATGAAALPSCRRDSPVALVAGVDCSAVIED